MSLQEFALENIILILAVAIALVTVWKGVKVVPQSEVYVVERFGRYTRTLQAGLNLLVPFLDDVAHKISVLERQLPEFTISVITRDNVEVQLEATVFYRILTPHGLPNSRYRRRASHRVNLHRALGSR